MGDIANNPTAYVLEPPVVSGVQASTPCVVLGQTDSTIVPKHLERSDKLILQDEDGDRSDHVVVVALERFRCCTATHACQDKLAHVGLRNGAMRVLHGLCASGNAEHTRPCHVDCDNVDEVHCEATMTKRCVGDLQINWSRSSCCLCMPRSFALEQDVN